MKIKKYLKNKVREFLSESNKIEGVFDKGSLKQALLAWEYLSKQKVLTVGVILKTHKILSLHSHLMPNEKGYFRRVPVWIGGEEGIRWDKIPDAIDEWLKDVETTLIVAKDSTVEQNEKHIRIDHITFEKCHPMIDFNGRLGRLMFLWEYQMVDILVELSPLAVVKG